MELICETVHRLRTLHRFHVCVNMTAGVCSSIAVFLVCILVAVTTFCLAVAERDWKILFKVGAACIPNVIYMGIYVFMAYSYLL